MKLKTWGLYLIMTAFLIGGCRHKQGGQEIEHAGNHTAELEGNQEIEKTSAVVVMTTESEPESAPGLKNSIIP